MYKKHNEFETVIMGHPVKIALYLDEAEVKFTGGHSVGHTANYFYETVCKYDWLSSWECNEDKEYIIYCGIDKLITLLAEESELAYRHNY